MIYTGKKGHAAMKEAFEMVLSCSDFALLSVEAAEVLCRVC